MDSRKQKSARGRKKMQWNLAVNLLLLLFGFLTIVSGLTLQQGYHRSRAEEQSLSESQINQSHDGSGVNPPPYEQLRGIDTNRIILGLGYAGWAIVHKWVVVFLSFFILYHIQAHWNWYTRVDSSSLIRKNTQAAILSVLFVFVALTGMIPWSVDVAGGRSALRLLLIELHDKLALLLIIFLIIHFTKRMKWYTSTYKKLMHG